MGNKLRRPVRCLKRMAPLEIKPAPNQETIVIKNPKMAKGIKQRMLDAINAATAGIKFRGKNPTFARYREQTPEERGKAWEKMTLKNKDWLVAAYGVDKVAWVKVLNGKAVDAGFSFATVPYYNEIYKEAKRIGVVPYLHCTSPDW